jgi:hypothetical protein
MKTKDYILLFLLGLGSASLVASFQSVPGYSDAAYNFLAGNEIASGNGFQVPIIWNFLNNIPSIPSPSHLYWMPLPSLIAAFGIKFIPGTLSAFEKSQAIFILLTGLAPIFTSNFAYKFSNNRLMAYFVGLLTVFSGSYFKYTPAIDSISVLMILGSLLWITLLKPAPSPIVLGILVGFIHLTRADGILWVLFTLTYILLQAKKNEMMQFEDKSLIKKGASFFGGYLIIMLPWYFRNVSLFGSLTPPGNFRTIWIKTYNDIFIYPASLLNFEQWWDQGLQTILIQRAKSLGTNFLSLIVVLGFVFLFPLIIVSIRKNWDRFIIKWGTLSLVAYIFVVSMLFPFASTRGTVFHTTALFFPFTAMLAIDGLSHVLKWMQKNKGWKYQQPLKVFSITSIIFAIIFSSSALYLNVLTPTDSSNIWNDTAHRYQRIGNILTDFGMQENERIMAISAAQYAAINYRETINIPNGNESTLRLVAETFDISYILLDENHPDGLKELFQHPENATQIEYLFTTDDTHIFYFEGN